MHRIPAPGAPVGSPRGATAGGTSPEHAAAVVPREAATVMLVREAPELEVFMLRRSPSLHWVSGAHVFPGGALEPGDRDPALLARCVGGDDLVASRRLGHPQGAVGYWVAALREAFEEAGVLLALDGATGAAVDGSRTALAEARDALNRGQASFLELLEGADLRLDLSEMRVFSHWITPPGLTRRYDTWFFVAPAPEGHAYLHDGGEADASEWVRPRDVLAAADRGAVELILPTRRNLEALDRFAGIDDLLGWLDAVADAPRVVEPGPGERVPLPGELSGEGVA